MRRANVSERAEKNWKKAICLQTNVPGGTAGDETFVVCERGDLPSVAIIHQNWWMREVTECGTPDTALHEKLGLPEHVFDSAYAVRGEDELRDCYVIAFYREDVEKAKRGWRAAMRYYDQVYPRSERSLGIAHFRDARFVECVWMRTEAYEEGSRRLGKSPSVHSVENALAIVESVFGKWPQDKNSRCHVENNVLYRELVLWVEDGPEFRSVAKTRLQKQDAMRCDKAGRDEFTATWVRNAVKADIIAKTESHEAMKVQRELEWGVAPTNVVMKSLADATCTNPLGLRVGNLLNQKWQKVSDAIQGRKNCENSAKDRREVALVEDELARDSKISEHEASNALAATVEELHAAIGELRGAVMRTLTEWPTCKFCQEAYDIVDVKLDESEVVLGHVCIRAREHDEKASMTYRKSFKYSFTDEQKAEFKRLGVAK